MLRPPWIISALTLAVIGLAFPAVRHLREETAAGKHNPRYVEAFLDSLKAAGA